MSEHLSRDEMIQRLYGLDTGARHLAECPKCVSDYQTLEARKADLTAPEEIPAQFFASQRRAVYSRMGAQPRSIHPWVPALATAALLAVGIFVYTPLARIYQPSGRHTVKVVPAAQSEVGDEQLFSEAVSFEQTVEPRAVAPIHGLFQGNE